jgi:hypothetical protein
MDPVTSKVDPATRSPQVWDQGLRTIPVRNRLNPKSAPPTSSIEDARDTLAPAGALFRNSAASPTKAHRLSERAICLPSIGMIVVLPARRYGVTAEGNDVKLQAPALCDAIYQSASNQKYRSGT